MTHVSGCPIVVVGRLHEPRSHDGHREALRVHTITRAGVVRARTAAINELKALVLTAPDDVRRELRHLSSKALVAGCATWRGTPQRPVAERCGRNTMRPLARRIRRFNDEITNHDNAVSELVDEAAPQLPAEPGIGHVTAAMSYIAWSHAGASSATSPDTSTGSSNTHPSKPSLDAQRRITSALAKSFATSG